MGLPIKKLPFNRDVFCDEDISIHVGNVSEDIVISNSETFVGTVEVSPLLPTAIDKPVKKKARKSKPRKQSPSSSNDDESEGYIQMIDSSESDVGADDDPECLFCTGLFSEDRRGEKWPQCCRMLSLCTVQRRRRTIYLSFVLQA
ncbi:hypothetical protein PR048_030320, partial [Dryococelus australis]